MKLSRLYAMWLSSSKTSARSAPSVVRMRSQSSCSWAFPLFGSVLTVTLLIDNGASDVWRSYWPSLTSSRWAGGYCLGRSFRGKRRVTQISNMCSYDNHTVEREKGSVALLGIHDHCLGGFALGGEFGVDLWVGFFQPFAIKGLGCLFGSSPFEESLNSSVSAAGNFDFALRLHL